jgi:hypothetical protein
LARRKLHGGLTLKDRNITAHAKKRFAERFGMYANRQFRLRVLRLIWEGKSQLIRRRSNSRSVHLVLIDGVPVQVVYDKRRRRIITCFPHLERGSSEPQTEGPQGPVAT